ncbi:sugar nucleotide-binding protein [Candidatus Pelagibacter sp.]|nr:sugar nucleotide-binding protein [Candidatus Pelagibacter sp.]
MKKKKNKIVVSGGNGRFATVLRKTINSKNYYFPTKSQMNILSLGSLEKYLKLKKPKYFLHVAALSRPMSIHDKKISESIDINIIGTSNVVKVCEKFKIKLIYFSTGYVYPGIKGNYTEHDSVNPINKYAISKLGGECAVKMYDNSLILRIMMCEKPFIHKSAFYDIKTNFIFQEDVAKMIPKLLNKKGIINIGGKTQSVYNFAKRYNKKIKKISGKKIFPPNPSMNVSKLKKII